MERDEVFEEEETPNEIFGIILHAIKTRGKKAEWSAWTNFTFHFLILLPNWALSTCFVD